MQPSECEELVREATEASRHSLEVSARIFEDAAKCFDKQGDRKKAGQYLTVAGDFFLDLDKKEKAATCYGKAIMRHLMADDITTAEILIEKGKEYGFSSSTHQYRIALDALERQPKIEEDKTEEVDKEIERLPDIDVLPIEEEGEEDLIPLDADLFSLEEDVLPKEQQFRVPQLEMEEKLSLGSFAVLAAASQAARMKSNQEISTSAIIKNVTGESQFLEPEFTISSIQPTDSQEYKGRSKVISSAKTSTTEELAPSESLKKEDTLELDYSAKSEITNEFEDEILDIEVVNTIPFNFQVIDVKSNLELDERKRTNNGLVFTWRKDRIEPGEKISVEYILRKRVERSIIMRKEKNKVSIVNVYHSVQQDLHTNLEFVNTSGNVFHEILVEDVIPPELIVTKTTTNKKIKPVTIPTHDSTLYRWIFSTLSPGDNFSVFYDFREKPLTRHYIDEIDCDKGMVKIEKISQPVVDSNQCEYLWYYYLENPISKDFTIIDRIPSDFNVVLVDPPHLNPSIKNEKTHQLLTWQLSSNEVLTTIVLKINGSESFTPLAPSIEFTTGVKLQLVERSSISEKRMVDLRRLRKKVKE
ncbi:MAG: hypothetical protein ACFFB2_01150 [Promethearchaeota archaeon]